MGISVQKRNKIYLETMRIVATYFVIFNHTDANGYWLYAQYERTAPQYWLYMPVSVFCRFSVWLFLMISGALLLEKKESYRKIIKRISRITIILIVFSFLYYLQQIKLEGIAFNIKSFLLQLYMGKINPYFWYLYAYIAFLLSLPLLRKLIHSLDVKEFNYMIIIEMLFVGLLPIGEFILFGGGKTLEGNLRLGWITSNIVLFPCIGYFLEYKLDIVDIKWKQLLCLWGFNIVCIALSCYMTYYKAVFLNYATGEWSDSFFTSFILVNAATIYVTIKKCFMTLQLSQTAEKLVFSIGSCTFGVYLIHRFFLKSCMTEWLWSILHTHLSLNYMLSALIYSMVIMLVSCGTVWLFKKIPVIGKLI